MATATGNPIQQPAPRDPRVYHPLDQLRGIIRWYVVIEGILSALIFLAVWYILALILDYGVFKVFTWDWVQDGAWWLRAVTLGLALALLAGILVFRIVRRLTTELSYPALALVLERRFPKVLGDRLITAVELADVDQAARYGYSAAMIRQTIDEARERVGTVPVQEVFNWRRLWLMGLIVVGLLLGVMVFAYASYAIATRSASPTRAGWKLYHVTHTLAERDLLLRDTPWPRRALLSLDDKSRNGLRAPKDGAAPQVRVRSYRWVIADRTVPDGWRPLMWSDVTEDLVGMSIPKVPFASLNLPDEPSSRTAFGAVAGTVAMSTTTTFPDENRALPGEPADWTVDALWERARDNPAVRSKLGLIMGSEDYLALQTVFDQLEAIGDDPSYGRRLRRLDPPSKVEFVYTGFRTAGGGTLNPEAHGEYAGEIGGLKEDVEFVVKAEDFRTPPRPITLVPVPTLQRLSRIEYQPAYLHYAPPLIPNPEQPGQMIRQGYTALRGLRQMMPEAALSLTGDRSVFVVPSGTEVVISGLTELPIANAWVVPKVGRLPGARVGSAARVPLRITDRSPEHGSRPLTWAEVTPALVGLPVPEFSLLKLKLDTDRTTPSTNATDWMADDVVARIRGHESVREQLRADLGTAGMQTLERVLAVLDEKARDQETGRYMLWLGRTFVLELKDDFRVTTQLEFDLVFENEDRVANTRQVLIQVTEDEPPKVQIATEAIRKVGKFYWVTPRAKIPFYSGSDFESFISDKEGLSKVEYTVSYGVEESALSRALRASMALRGFIAPVGPGPMPLPGVLQSAYHTHSFRAGDKSDDRRTASFVVGQFNAMERGVVSETEAHLKSLLTRPLTAEKPNLVKRVRLKTELVEVGNKLIPPDSTEPNRPRTAQLLDSNGNPLRVKVTIIDRRLEGNRVVKVGREVDRTFSYFTELQRQVRGDYFDVRALGLEVEAGEIQPQYQVILDIQATDSNYDTGPKVATNTAGTPPGPLALMVVSAGDLLTEIGKEEQELGKKLDDVLQKLAGARKKYEFVHLKNGYAPIEEIDAVKVRSKDTLQDLAKARELVYQVARDFRKIERECIVNDLDERTITHYGKLANRLERVLGESPRPVSPDESRAIAEEDLRIAQQLQQPRPTFAETEKLMGLGQSQLEWTGDGNQRIWADAETVTDAMLELNRLYTEIDTIRKLLGEAASRETLRNWLRDLIGKQRGVGKELERLFADYQGRLRADTPEITTVGPVFLAKGETKKIRHNINWRQYRGDTLEVKLTSSDPAAVIAPAMLKLDFETNTLNFDYELRAGNKEGEFTVTLTPAAGAKVEVKVTVK